VSTTVELREGDVYQFHYSDDVRQKWRTDPYWCFDGQVVVRSGELCDTYWGFSAGEPRVVRPDEGAMTFICNLGDVRDVKEYETRHYAEADVFNLSYQHGCYKRFAVRKDASRNQDRMLAEVEQRMSDLLSKLETEVRSVTHDFVRLGECRAKIQSGELNAVNLWW